MPAHHDGERAGAVPETLLMRLLENRWLVPIGKQVMEGEVERGRDDERHRLRRQRMHLKDHVQQAEDRIGHDDAANAGDMEASAPLEPGAAMARQMAEGDPVVWNEVRQDRDLGGEQKSEVVLKPVGQGGFRQLIERQLQSNQVDDGRDAADEKIADKPLHPLGAPIGQPIREVERAIYQAHTRWAIARQLALRFP